MADQTADPYGNQVVATFDDLNNEQFEKLIVQAHTAFGSMTPILNGCRLPTPTRYYGKVRIMSPRNSAATLEAVNQEIIDLVRAEVGAVDLTADSSLQGQGLDSLRVMSLIFKIEARYDILLDEEDADDMRTVGDLAALVVGRIEGQP